MISEWTGVPETEKIHRIHCVSDIWSTLGPYSRNYHVSKDHITKILEKIDHISEILATIGHLESRENIILAIRKSMMVCQPSLKVFGGLNGQNIRNGVFSHLCREEEKENPFETRQRLLE